MEWLTSWKIHLKNTFVFTENFPSHPSPSVNTSLSLKGSSSYAWEIEGIIWIRELKLKALSLLFQDWNPSLLIPYPVPFLLYAFWGIFVFGTFLVKKKILISMNYRCKMHSYVFLDIHMCALALTSWPKDRVRGFIHVCIYHSEVLCKRLNLGDQMYIMHCTKTKEMLICFCTGKLGLSDNCKCQFIWASEVSSGDWLQHLGDTYFLKVRLPPELKKRVLYSNILEWKPSTN